MAREGQFSRTTEKSFHQSKMFGWSVNQREGIFDRFATLILLICVLSVNSLFMEVNFLYAHLYPS